MKYALLFVITLVFNFQSALASGAVRLDLSPVPSFPLNVRGMAMGGGDGEVIAAGGVMTEQLRMPPAVWKSLSTLHRFHADSGGWTAFETGDARAFAASVMQNGALICIGGIRDQELTASVMRYEVVGEEVQVRILPDLPRPLAMARAVVHNRSILVFGGAVSLDPLILNDQIFSLPVTGPALEWSSRSAPFPGRVLPVVATQLDAVFVGGGWDMDAADGSWILLQDFWRFRIEGSRSGEPWTEVAPPPVPLGDAHAFSIGQSHLGFVNIPVEGGEKALAGVFDPARRNVAEVISYHAITDTWYSLADMQLASGPLMLTEWEVMDQVGVQRIKRRVPLLWSENGTEEGLALTELRVRFPKGRLHGLDYLMMAVYAAVMIWLGIHYAKKEKNSEDFFVGGRRIPWWAAAISAQATGASAITMMAIPALIYKESIVYFGGLFLGIIPAVLSAIYLVPIIRKMNVVSIYEYLGLRFGRTVRLLAAAVYVISQVVGRMGVVVMLPAMALSAVTGINVYSCIVGLGLVVIFYTTLGGISSVIWSDVIQFLIMLGGAFVCVFLILARIDGGVGAFLDVSRDYEKWRLFNFSLDFTVPVFWVLLFMAPLGAFQGISDQAFIQRIASVKDIKGAQKATVWNYLWALPLQTGMWVVGIALFVFFRNFPEQLDPTLATDTVFPQFIARQLPAGLSGLMIVGILAAAMSSLDSSMNSVSTVVVTDFYRLFRPDAQEKSCLRLARAVTILTGVMGVVSAIYIARLDLSSGQEAFGRIMGLITGGFPGLFMLALLTRRGNSAGAISGVIAASLMVFLIQKHTAVNWMLYAAIAFTTSIGVGYLVSILTGRTRKDLTGLTVWDLNHTP